MVFDERDPKWIKIYKNYTLAMFWLLLIAGVVMCFLGWAEELWWTDSAFVDGLICLAAGGFGAFIHLVVNMLVLQFLNNVQLIRESLEKQ